MATTFRNPWLRVLVNGRLLPRVKSAEWSLGFDQEYGTASFTLPYPFPFPIPLKARVYIEAGISTNVFTIQRFVGFVSNPVGSAFPGQITINCGDYLWLASQFKPEEEIATGGMNGKQIVIAAMNAVGIPAQLGGIQGPADPLVPPVFWTADLTALQMIQEADRRDNYKTFMLGGGAVRIPIPEVPSNTHVEHWSEGSGGNMIGQADISIEPMPLDSDLEQVLPQQGVGRVVLTTHLDGRYQPSQTHKVTSTHIWLANGVRLLLQNVTGRCSEGGGFTQQLTLVSHVFLAEFPVDDPITGEPVEPDPPIEPDPDPGPNTDVLASFVLLPIEVERMLIGGVPTLVYWVHATDTSISLTGTIVARTWAAAGTGVQVAAGSGVDFLTGFTDLASATISIEAEDSNGSTGTAEMDLTGGGGVPIRTRELQAALADIEMFDGSAWRSDTAPVDVRLTARGPYWAEGETFYRTANDLVTSATASVPVSGKTFSALWAEIDAFPTDVWAAYTDGTVIYSADSGATWTTRTAPAAVACVRLVASRFNQGELHFFSATAWYQSLDGGVTWGTILEAAVGQTVRDACLAPARIFWAGDGGSSPLQSIGPGTMTDLTFPALTPAVSRINAITPHPTKDLVLAADDQTPPRLFMPDSPGSNVMAQVGSGGDAPGTYASLERALAYEFSMPGKFYMARGTDGLWAVFPEQDLEHPIRQQGIDGAPPSGVWYQVEPGELVVRTPAVTPALYIAAGGRSIATWDGTTWDTLTVSTFGVSDGVESIAVDPTNPATIYAMIDDGTLVAKSSDSGATWANLTLPSGVSGSLQTIICDSVGNLYLVGLFAAGYVYKSTNGGSSFTLLISTAGMASGNVTTRNIAFTPNGKIYIGEADGSGTIARQFLADGSGRLDISGLGDFRERWVYAAPDNENRGWVCFFNGTSGEVLHLITSGTSADLQPSGTTSCAGVLDLGGSGASVAAVGTFFASGTATLRRTTDTGANWSTVATGADYAAAGAARGPLFGKNVAGTLYYAADAKLHQSVDQGVTWTEVVGCPTSDNAALAVAG
jgi:hypothetical protein